MSIDPPADTDLIPTKSFPRSVLLYLSASVLQGLLAFVALPLATLILGPADYGLYALVTSIALAFGTITDLGQNILFSGHYPEADSPERRKMLTSVLAASLVMAGVAGAVFVEALPWLWHLLGIGQELSSHILWAAAACLPLRAINTTASHYFAVAVRSGSAALLISAQAIGTFIVTMVSLFVFDLNVLSLFLGSAAGMFIAAAGAMILMRDALTVSVEARWFFSLFRVAPSSIVAAASENVRTAVENSLMARFIGTGSLGLWSHARLYYGLLLQGTNAVAYVLWPKALDEARNGERFDVVGRAWNAIYLWLVLIGVILAMFGREVVSFLTNGKFVDAALWIPVWVAFLLLQNAGKAATATVYARKKGVWAANFRVITLAPCILALWLLVPRFGISGVMVVLFAEMVIFRMLIGYYARRLRHVPFQDGWVLGGSMLVMGMGWISANTAFDIPTRVALSMFVVAAVMIMGHRAVVDTVNQLCAALRVGDVTERSRAKR